MDADCPFYPAELVPELVKRLLEDLDFITRPSFTGRGRSMWGLHGFGNWVPLHRSHAVWVRTKILKRDVGVSQVRL
ncbi:MAG: hypothetical protein CM15mP78_15040 [Candidatus Poseidoniales archaeon]|nr:MAG: hypothetical protein CM15mP78_15040 [Candidatus Poseidoniales archaeon]